MSASIKIKGKLGVDPTEMNSGEICTTLLDDGLDKGSQKIEGVDPTWFVLRSTDESKNYMKCFFAGDQIEVAGQMNVYSSKKEKVLVVDVHKISILSLK